MKILIIIGIITGIIMLAFYLKTDHPIKNAFKSMFAGACVLLLVSFFGKYVDFELPLSFFNTGVSLLLGIPGVVLLVIGHFILV